MPMNKSLEPLSERMLWKRRPAQTLASRYGLYDALLELHRVGHWTNRAPQKRLRHGQASERTTQEDTTASLPSAKTIPLLSSTRLLGATKIRE